MCGRRGDNNVRALSIFQQLKIFKEFPSMLRSGISILVIAGILASQILAIPHSHGAAFAGDQHHHNAASHFHLRWFRSPVAPQATCLTESAGDETQADEVVADNVGLEHDADAIYVLSPNSMAGANSRTSADGRFAVQIAGMPDNNLLTAIKVSTRLPTLNSITEKSDLLLHFINLRI